MLKGKWAKVTDGKFKGKKVKIIGEDSDVWHGKSWLDMPLHNLAVYNYANRLIEYSLPTKGRVFACELDGLSKLFHESQLELINQNAS